jgi:hypothetical protein
MFSVKMLPEHHEKSVPMTTVEGRGVLTFLFPRGTVVLKCGLKHSKDEVIPLVVSYIFLRSFTHIIIYFKVPITRYRRDIIGATSFASERHQILQFQGESALKIMII